ncbi:MAG: hypothetical protein WAR61_02805 [Candidatus Microthrix parvicella]|jgi:hypothetical protein
MLRLKTTALLPTELMRASNKFHPAKRLRTRAAVADARWLGPPLPLSCLTSMAFKVPPSAGMVLTLSLAPTNIAQPRLDNLFPDDVDDGQLCRDLQGEGFDLDEYDGG